MKSPSLDELVLLPEPVALQRHFDARNYRVFRWAWALISILSVVGIAASLSQHRYLLFGACAFDLVATIALFAMRRTAMVEKYFRQVLLAWLAYQLVLVKLLSGAGGDSGPPLFGMFAFSLLLFRFRPLELLLLYGAAWITAVLPPGWLGLNPHRVLSTDDIAALTTMDAIFFGLTVLLSYLEKRRFLLIWRKEHARSRERLRMREEIQYARKIQLSMLPQAPPAAGWLDLAGASLPATEVGGDYYDYFALSPSQLAVVIADVAGHGLASGLLLSGVRSCLYLLEKELAEPAAVLDRLNVMVRRTTDRRTYVTLLCAILDREGGTLTVANAGHPPVLCFRPQTRKFTEVGQGAPPLGTFLQACYVEERQPIASHDLLIFYTDGLTEARNDRGQDYGQERLEKVVARTWGGTVREIRDAILSDLSSFKGDGAEQEDDITVVVARVK
jgi:serine phosphatase RsbU (regulator of sigma subunit)